MTKIIKAKTDTIRIITICDLHLSPHNPTVYKVDYWKLMKSTLNQLFAFAIKNEVDVIAVAGDVFHLKSGSRNPHWFIAETLNLLKIPEEAGIQVVGIAGNHDVKFGSAETGLEGQPLDVLIAAGRYQLLDKEELLIEGKSVVRIAGSSYKHARAEGARDKKKDKDEILITLGHFWFGPATGEMYGEPVFGPEFFDGSDTDVYVIGHHHEDQGIHKRGKKQFVSHGSFTRTGAHKHDIERRPAAGLIEIDKGPPRITVLRPNVPPAKDVMDLSRRKQIMEEKEEMTEFISSLQETIMTVVDPKEILLEVAPNEQIRERALQYLEEAEEKKT